MTQEFNLIHSKKVLLLIKRGCKYPRCSFQSLDMYARSYLCHLLLDDSCKIFLHDKSGIVYKVLKSE
jgi:hypothetical protein